MQKHRNVLQRALDALIEGRARKAQRFIEDYERDHAVQRQRKL